MQKKAIVCGAGGFIGSFLVKQLKKEGFWVRGVDLKYPEYDETAADEFYIGDLRDPKFTSLALRVNGGVDELFQLAADMGGAGFVFTGENDYDIMHNSTQINLNVTHTARHFKKFSEKQLGIKKIFYSSSACMYPERNQLDPDNPNCAEDSAYPADPDSEYGWEKLYSERIFRAFERETGIPVRISRFHNIFGPLGTWDGGREKAPAAMCRKVAECPEGGEIEVWGDGSQTRSFLYVDECVNGILRLIRSDCQKELNIGSEEMVSINQLAQMAINISGKDVKINNVQFLANGSPVPLGVMGRNSDNKLIKQELGWEPDYPLIKGMGTTYKWIEEQVKKVKG